MVHGKEEKTFDYASSSQLNTSILAWYADVPHEVKPITSGFRLALSYNLIKPDHISLPLPPPDGSFTSKLKRIFSDWSKGSFDELPVAICYKLRHEYSQENYSRGFACLKGIDAHITDRIRHAAEGLGFGICLGQLVLHIEAEGDESKTRGDDQIFESRKKRRYDEFNEYDDGDSGDEGDDDGDDEGFDYKGEEMDRTMEVNGLVDLNGNIVVPLDKYFYVDGEQALFIPKNAFRGIEPDEVEQYVFTGNVSRSFLQFMPTTNEKALAGRCNRRKMLLFLPILF